MFTSQFCHPLTGEWHWFNVYPRVVRA